MAGSRGSRQQAQAKAGSRRNRHQSLPSRLKNYTDILENPKGHGNDSMANYFAFLCDSTFQSTARIHGKFTFDALGQGDSQTVHSASNNHWYEVIRTKGESPVSLIVCDSVSSFRTKRKMPPRERNALRQLAGTGAGGVLLIYLDSASQSNSSDCLFFALFVKVLAMLYKKGEMSLDEIARARPSEDLRTWCKKCFQSNSIITPRYTLLPKSSAVAADDCDIITIRPYGVEAGATVEFFSPATFQICRSLITKASVKDGDAQCSTRLVAVKDVRLENARWTEPSMELKLRMVDAFTEASMQPFFKPTVTQGKRTTIYSGPDDFFGDLRGSKTEVPILTDRGLFKGFVQTVRDRVKEKEKSAR